VVAARAPGLREALERALAEGTPYLIQNGKVVDADRCREKPTSRKGQAIDVASDPVISRLVSTLAADAPEALRAIRTARPSARKRAWALAREAAPVQRGA
jgi:hypothetical protein